MNLLLVFELRTGLKRKVREPVQVAATAPVRVCFDADAEGAACVREGTPLRDQKPTGFNIAFPVHYSNYAPGNTAPDNYFVFFVNFNRDQQVTNRGVVELRNREDALVMWRDPGTGAELAGP